MWRVKWSYGKRALRLLPEKQQAIRFAKEKSGGRYSVIVHTPSGYADVKHSIMVPPALTAAAAD
jgi:hypothetical protein